MRSRLRPSCAADQVSDAVARRAGAVVGADASRMTMTPRRPQLTGRRPVGIATVGDAGRAAPVRAEERVAKLMANRGLCSRREAERLIEQGAVVVNGVVIREQGCK